MGPILNKQTKNSALVVVGALLILSVPMLYGVRGWQASTAPDAYTGTWINKEADTRGIAKIEINPADGKLVAQAWGACRPQSCDWGKQVPTFGRNNANVVWDLGAIRVVMALRIRDGQMVIRVNYEYSDGRASSQEVAYFDRLQ
jgi:hypothetical protein